MSTSIAKLNYKVEVMETVADKFSLPGKRNESFAIFFAEASIATPIFIAKKNTKFDIRRSHKEQRRVSETSEESIVFDYDDCDENQQDDDSYSDDSETETDEDEDSDTLDEEETHDKMDSGVEGKRVRFDPKPKVLVMRVWDFAYRACRKGDCWQQIARDHERFRRRILQQHNVISQVLGATHREKIFHERFQ